MDDRIERLFEEAQLFDEGELSRSREYRDCISLNLELEEEMKKRFGSEAHKLLMKFLDSYYEVERFNCLHYFYQGYLAGKEQKKDLT